MGDQHGHHHSTKNIRLAFFLNLGFTIFEIIGGIYVNSVAIISDAVHDLGDSLSLGTSWFLQKKSQKEANAKYSYGHRRLSLLAALINAIVLIIGSVFVVSESIKRLFSPEHSDADGMILFAVIGVLVNGFAAYKMSSGKSLNERMVTWHLLEDVLGWVAILIVAIILKFEDNPYLDPALSILITLYILWNIFKRLKETLHLFLQGHPSEIDRDDLESKILSISKVQSIHHMHIWSLDGEHHVFSCHICIEDNSTNEDLRRIKSEAKNTLRDLHFEHITIELEFANEECDMRE